MCIGVNHTDAAIGSRRHIYYLVNCNRYSSTAQWFSAFSVPELNKGDPQNSLPGLVLRNILFVCVYFLETVSKINV